MKLLNIDPDSDIAVYRVVSEEEFGEIKPAIITADSLYALPPTFEWPVFSVAYAQGDFPFTTGQGKATLKTLKDWDKRAQDLEQRTQYSNLDYLEMQIKRFDSKYTVFEFFRDRYMDRVTGNEVRDLAAFKKNVRFSHDPRKSMPKSNGLCLYQPPQFRQIFQENHIAIAVGEVKQTNKDHDALKDEELNRLFVGKTVPREHVITNELHYSISTWYGCSGGMVGVLSKDDSEQVQPRIVGIGEHVFMPFLSPSRTSSPITFLKNVASPLLSLYLSFPHSRIPYFTTIKL